jgi:predicted ribosome quality control (RQC) complex YloA/Tae2 family protein
MKLTKPELTSLELRSVVKELQFLVGGKVDQIYQSGKKEFFLQVHVPRLGKKVIRIVVGSYMYMTSHKPPMEEPRSFCMQLRKRLSGGTITSFEQVDSQRIVKVVVEKDEKWALFVELFSKGNIILCDSDLKMKGVLEKQTWQSRELKVNDTYVLPPMDHDAFRLKKKEFFELVSASSKEKLVLALATELSLGGMYAEELCVRAGVDKDTVPSNVSEKQLGELWAAWQVMLNESWEPYGFFCGKVISPISLQSINVESKEKTFTDVLDASLSKSKEELERAVREATYQKKLDELQRILDDQDIHLEKAQKIIDSSTTKGDWIYEKYQDVQKLLDAVEKAREEGGWDGVKEMLKGVKKVTGVTMKEKKVTISVK